MTSTSLLIGILTPLEEWRRHPQADGGVDEGGVDVQAIQTMLKDKCVRIVEAVIKVWPNLCQETDDANSWAGYQIHSRIIYINKPNQQEINF